MTLARRSKALIFYALSISTAYSIYSGFWWHIPYGTLIAFGISFLFASVGIFYTVDKD